MKNDEGVWLDGYYPPDMDAVGGFDKWQELWSMGPHAEADWILFPNGYYTESMARAILETAGPEQRRGRDE